MNISDSDRPISSEGFPSGDADNAGQEVSPKAESGVKIKPKPKVLAVQTVNQLLRAVYSGTFKRSTLKKTELNIMRTAPRLDTSEKKALLYLASSDRTLDKTLKLMLLGAGLEAPVLTDQMREFAGQVLQHHPAFRTNVLEDILTGVQGALGDNEAVQELLSRDYSSFSWPKEAAGMKSMTRKDLDQCKANAVGCLLLWFKMTHKISLERIQHLIQEHLWRKRALPRYKTETQKLRALMTTRDFAAASIAYSLVERQTLEQKRRADAAIRAEERAKSHVLEMHEKLSKSQKKLTETQSEVDRLGRELGQEIEAHANNRAHLKDDYEKIRGQVLRRLKDELSLLDDGLHALRRDPPKVHVMIDHAERAMDGLKREMERLRGNN